MVLYQRNNYYFQLTQFYLYLSKGLHEKDKPGKLSSDLLNKFKSDPALTCLQPLPVGHGLLSAQSFTSSSEEMSTSQGNIKLAQTSAVIKVPDNSRDPLSPSSGDEDILSDDETGTTKDKKKRKSRWKWSPLKRMKKIFRRKKSPTRVKSCEEIPAEHYKPTLGVSSLEDDASLRNRTKSEPSLAEAKTKSPQAVVELHERRNTFDNPVQTEQSKPMNRVSSAVGGGFFPWVKIISPMESRNRFVGSGETRFQNLPKHN